MATNRTPARQAADCPSIQSETVLAVRPSTCPSSPAPPNSSSIPSRRRDLEVRPVERVELSEFCALFPTAGPADRDGTGQYVVVAGAAGCGFHHFPGRVSPAPVPRGVRHRLRGLLRHRPAVAGRPDRGAGRRPCWSMTSLLSPATSGRRRTGADRAGRCGGHARLDSLVRHGWVTSYRRTTAS